MTLVVKNLPANEGDVRDEGSIPGLGRSPGEGHGNPLQYSCLANPMDRRAWQATVHRVAKSRIRLKQLSMHVGDIKQCLQTFFFFFWQTFLIVTKGGAATGLQGIEVRVNAKYPTNHQTVPTTKAHWTSHVSREEINRLL